MPKKPLKPCRYPGCPNLTDELYCEEHRKEARRKYDKYERRPDINKLYGRRWKRIRDAYVREHPFCEKCYEEGRLVPVTEVHHIIPINDGGTSDFDNLMSLCHSCHEKIHQKMAGRGN